MVDKKSLREELKATRAGILKRTEKERAALCHLLALHEVRCARRVLVYQSFGTEFSTQALISALLEDGKEVLLPRVEGKELRAILFTKDTPLRPGAYGIPEPVGPAQDPASIDLVLCPGLGFDARGGRLGYGAGYYDRFLKKTGAFRIGLCYNDCVLELIPTEATDEKMDALVTETGALYCRGEIQ